MLLRNQAMSPLSYARQQGCLEGRHLSRQVVQINYLVSLCREADLEAVIVVKKGSMCILVSQSYVSDMW